MSGGAGPKRITFIHDARRTFFHDFSHFQSAFVSPANLPSQYQRREMWSGVFRLFMENTTLNSDQNSTMTDEHMEMCLRLLSAATVQTIHPWMIQFRTSHQRELWVMEKNGHNYVVLCNICGYATYINISCKNPQYIYP